MAEVGKGLDAIAQATDEQRACSRSVADSIDAIASRTREKQSVGRTDGKRRQCARIAGPGPRSRPWALGSVVGMAASAISQGRRKGPLQSDVRPGWPASQADAAERAAAVVGQQDAGSLLQVEFATASFDQATALLCHRLQYARRIHPSGVMP